MVSIICNAYNHELYIRDALESFIMQKTSFAFEVLVHDDASTDKTADIIREYEAKYPEIIKPIYQTENQYSKGGGAVFNIQRERVSGKYIAFCEGDDYWTDPNKLQKQYEALEAHPEIDICAHAALRVNAATGIAIDKVSPADSDTVLTVNDVILGDGGYVASASLFLRSTLFRDMPEFRRFLKLDYTMQIQGALRGGMLYLADCMSVYRFLTPGSWTSKMSKSVEKTKKHTEKLRKMLCLLNEETNFAYDEAIQKRLLALDFNYFLSVGEEKRVLNKKYRNLFNELSLTARIKIILKAAFPFLKSIKKK